MWGGVSVTSSFTANPLRLSKQHLLPTIAEKVLWFRKLELYLSPDALLLYAHALSYYYGKYSICVRQIVKLNLLTYADDVVLTEKNEIEVRQLFVEIENIDRKLGLHKNKETEHMIVERKK
jgi:Reverse transcriptase (RNA-dependent DNA polymerase).